MFPLPFPFVGMAERPIPVETRLKPNPPGLLAGVSRLRIFRSGARGGRLLTAVVGVEALIPRDVWNLSQTGSGYDYYFG